MEILSMKKIVKRTTNQQHVEITECLSSHYNNLMNLMDKFPVLKNHLKLIYFAGGAIRDCYYKHANGLAVELDHGGDIDIYFRNQKLADNFFNSVLECKNEFIKEMKRQNHRVEIKSDQFSNVVRVFSDSLEYQIICGFASQPNETIERFDFTVNMCYFVPSTELIYIKDHEAIKNKELVFNQTIQASNFKAVLILRAMKFQSKGWKMNYESFNDLMSSISDFDAEDLKSITCEVLVDNLKSKGLIA